jgi:Holliday junction resolvase RusA-like endonuclease
MARWLLPWPPSVNHLYARTARGQVRLTDEARAYREEVIVRVRQSGQTPPDLMLPLRVEIMLWGRTGRWDIDNVLKAALDALFLALGSDDSGVCELEVIKFIGGRERIVEVRLSEALMLPDEPVPTLRAIGALA